MKTFCSGLPFVVVIDEKGVFCGTVLHRACYQVAWRRTKSWVRPWLELCALEFHLPFQILNSVQGACQNSNLML